MHDVVYTKAALRDIKKALKDGQKMHGERAKNRYALLINTAILKLRENANRAGVQSWDDNHFMYHLKFAKNDATIDGIKVKSPRHYVFFRFQNDDLIIVRIIYDRSDFESHL